MKIAMYDLEGHFLELFEVSNVFELEKKLKLNGGIYACLSGKNLSTKRYQFKEVINENNIISRIGDVSSFQGQIYKPVHKFYKNNFICTYDNMVSASKKNRIDVSLISRCCNNQQTTAGGFSWVFAN